ncbi:MAG: 6,7-dimethyl-8-ribityllumazine synthase [Saezia sp.]
MQNADKGTPQPLNGAAFKIGIVQARFNADITDTLRQSAQTELNRIGVLDQNITLVQVAGALEIPLALQALADQDLYDALIAIACVIRGETYHFELVANESAAGITRVGLDYHIPIANVVLTTENKTQAQARMTEKGVDAARVAVEMAQLLNTLAI